MGRRGLSLVELLVILVILGVVLAIASFNGQRTLLGQQQAAFLNTLQGLFWEGATEAASRGRQLALWYQGNRLEIREGNQVRRWVEVPKGVVLNLPQGELVRFLPPGKLEGSGMALGSPFTVVVEDRTYTYLVSLIGEVKASQ
ncbi:MAG: prepilin-type N-terminal cleavage/methylation domain-containing protein [Thermus sp.]|nr:prepilin-type N-terminal cleavage/methylation domain-containing protein [Thermus sp.]